MKALSQSPGSPLATPRGRHRAILETAAKLICANGYERTSIQDIADACGLTKGGLYHHIDGKEHLLLEIMHYGMDVFEERVLSQVLSTADPVERLRQCMGLNILLVTDGLSQEVTIILNEHLALTGSALGEINARKKNYVRFLERSFREAVREGRIRRVEPKVAAFSFLGQVLWISKWFRPGGSLTGAVLAQEMVAQYFDGLELAPRPGLVPRLGGGT
jgi:AcrR family transcriptional regulator